MVQTRSSSRKNTTDTNVDVAEASNKNTMNQKIRKTIAKLHKNDSGDTSHTTKKVVNARRDAGTSKNSKSKSVVKSYVCKDILRKITKVDIAREAYISQCYEAYIKNHPGETQIPLEVGSAAKTKFDEPLKKSKYYFVRKVIKKMKDDEDAKYARNPRSEISVFRFLV